LSGHDFAGRTGGRFVQGAAGLFMGAQQRLNALAQRDIAAAGLLQEGGALSRIGTGQRFGEQCFLAHGGTSSFETAREIGFILFCDKSSSQVSQRQRFFFVALIARAFGMEPDAGVGLSAGGAWLWSALSTRTRD
jgi:hypothetical protein